MSITEQSNVLVWSEANIKKAPQTCGVYTLRTDTTVASIRYIGSAGAGRLRARLMEHYTTRDHPRTKYFHWAKCTNTENAQTLECNWIAKYNPPWNK